MTDTPRGPTTEELRARVADYWRENTAAAAPRRIARETQAARDVLRVRPDLAGSYTPPALLLPRPCLACNREQGERMCDLCQRLEEAEAGAA